MKQCVICGAEFAARRSNVLTCGQTCSLKRKANREKNRQTLHHWDSDAVLASARRRIRMLEDTIRRAREQLFYVEHSPTRDVLKLMFEAALETKAGIDPFTIKSLTADQIRSNDMRDRNGIIVHVGRICEAA